ncbi:MAG: metallophosphoesterase, partial [Caldilineaceae bacterium]|nr:metallophosphoesterase [Caldilineaceae bacterium]
MKIRFLHCADIHLGYVQYGHKDRFNDFASAFNALIDKALGEETVRRDGSRVSFDEKLTGKVDFVLLAGDLFHKRAIDALTLNQAMRALQRLRDAAIPCIAVEGNHELAYFDDTIGWMRFLALQDLLILLDAEFQDGVAQLKPWDARRRQGSYVDIKGTGGTVRVHGLRYYGASTATAINAYARALDELDHNGVDYTIFLTHAGLEGQMEDKAGGLSYRQWTALQPLADYVALGHFH